MSFDFFNYTFSAVISFVTAIFGMSYPLLIESIQKIDDRYRSQNLKARFEKSYVFLFFNHSLMLSVLMAFIVPFLLAAAQGSLIVRYVLISVQIALLFLFIFLTIMLVRQIQLYNDPRRLMSFVLQRASRLDLQAIIDIMRYASFIKDDELYHQGMEWIISLVMEENASYGRS